MTGNKAYGAYGLAAGVAALAVVVLAAFFLMRGSSPGNGTKKELSPREKMQRTEDTLAKFAQVIDMYHDKHKRWPASKDLSVLVDPGTPGRAILGEHIPIDAWDHFFFYIPSTEYKVVASGALGTKGKIYRPDTYQLYSPGADLDPGFYTEKERLDNINNWDQTRAWRPVYDQLEKAYQAYKHYAR